jgi:hypothetical protein
MRRSLLAAFVLSLALPALAQWVPMSRGVVWVTSAPAGACDSTVAPIQFVIGTAATWWCSSDVWTAHPPGGGHGDGADCSAGQYPLGVDANGAVQSCTADDDTPDSDAEVPDAITVAGGSVATSAITLVGSASPTPTVDGRIEWDSDDDQLVIGDGSGQVIISAGGGGGHGDGANCTAGNYPLGVDANGAVQSCTADDDQPDSDGEVPDAITVSGGSVASSTITLTQSANPTPTSEGIVEWDTDDDRIVVGDGSSQALFYPGAHAVVHADGANCSAGQYPLGVDADGAVQGCTADDDQPDSDGEVPDALTIAGGTIGTSAITLVQSATPTPTAEGVLEWDTDDDRLVVGDSTGQATFYAGAHTTTDHGGLTGLGDDDHPHYGQLTTAETVSGLWTFSQPPDISALDPDGDDTDEVTISDTGSVALGDLFFGVTGTQHHIEGISGATNNLTFDIDDDANFDLRVHADGTVQSRTSFLTGGGTAPTPTAEGQIEWDSDDDRFVVGDGSGQVEFYSGAHSGHADGANCSPAQYPLGVDASGAVQSCTADDDQPDNDGEVPDAITVAGGSVSTSTVTLEGAASPTPTTDGEIHWDTDDDQLVIGDGTGQVIIAPGGGGHADGANCSASNYPLGVDANGAVQSCTADDDTPDSDAEVPDAITVSAGTVTNSDVTLKQSTSPTPTAEGRIEWDTDDDQLVIGDGSGQVTIGAGGGGNPPVYCFAFRIGTSLSTITNPGATYTAISANLKGLALGSDCVIDKALIAGRVGANDATDVAGFRVVSGVTEVVALEGNWSGTSDRTTGWVDISPNIDTTNPATMALEVKGGNATADLFYGTTRACFVCE